MEAYFYDREGELFFHLDSPSIADVNAAPFVFDGPATEQHKASYEAQYNAYLENKKKALPIEEVPVVDEEDAPAFELKEIVKPELEEVKDETVIE